MEQKAIIQEGIKHQKPSREIRRQANKTNPDNIIGPDKIYVMKLITIWKMTLRNSGH
jgi:hypothetical protein